MKKGISILLAILVLATASKAQRYYGIANSNYAGINGLYINPGNIADNRMINDIQVFSGNVAVNQNYGYAKNFKALLDSFTNGKDVSFTKNNNASNIGFSALGEGRGPSFMFQVKKKHAVGLLTRVRLVGSGTGISSDFFTLVNEKLKSIKQGNGYTFNSGTTNVTLNLFSEIGIAYGREILNKGKNYLKGGIVVKRYNGLGYYNARLDNFNVKLLDTATSKVEFNGIIKGSKSFDNAKGFDNVNTNNILVGGPGSGFGFDIGAVYEYRDGEPISESRADNKYKFKIGFALQDIGAMVYKASPNTQNFTLNTNGVKIVSRVDTANLSFDDLNTYFTSIGVTPTNDNNSTKVLAPTALTIYGDYKISKKIYVNALFTTGLIGKKTAGSQTPMQVIVTPRLEGKFLEFGLPISYNGLSKDVKVGAGLRLGFLFLGSDDLLSSITGLSKITGANVYAGLRAAVPYRKAKTKKVKDDIAEIVPEVVKPVETVEPPKVAEPVDTDKDGIVDTEDKCPTVQGLKEFAGCADTDADGIQDNEDKCPSVKGLKEFEGCPDTDADGIQDSEDDCPTEKGLATFKGCPDTDGDGVADKDDKCVDRPGPIDNAGCPRIAEVVKKKLAFAAKAIQFEVNKDIIRKISFTQLDEVVKILNEYADYEMIIDGHTDNSGKVDKNQILSQKRAESVKNYFVKKGIDAARMKATGFGDTKPLVKNTTAINKAKNRRVELSLKLKD
jgi:outer membrane protein OmpA-like peptidoglycan-associated protein